MRSQIASSHTASPTNIVSPTAADPMSLTRPIKGSWSSVTRSASFSMAVLSNSTTMTATTTTIMASRVQLSVAIRIASGTDNASVNSSWRNAASLEAAARRPFRVFRVARRRRCKGLWNPVLGRRTKSENAAGRIGAEFERALHEDADIFDFPVDRLRVGGVADHVILEMGQALRIHAPVSAADREADVGI